ncbi:hypothetical protein Riv7116_1850 [Rivularia sp. PCC 7116]|uniref:hypothetical protein n=1 Tax=Rivularia sp. PCC 7116 TaxID=373994 RepID=UPI00029F2D91|nr:hypothetical protein [Rivularia sp. PCC 7116]AFY54391.1 hypothetical protein Riv7116_1850 [Rivularia sp. PCC 7116]
MPAPFAQTDLNSDNQPAALLELAFQLQASELTVPEETRPNNLTIAIDGEEGTATVTATLPVEFSLDASGKPIVTATDYIPVV